MSDNELNDTPPLEPSDGLSDNEEIVKKSKQLRANNTEKSPSGANGRGKGDRSTEGTADGADDDFDEEKLLREDDDDQDDEPLLDSEDDSEVDSEEEEEEEEKSSKRKGSSKLKRKRDDKGSSKKKSSKKSKAGPKFFLDEAEEGSDEEEEEEEYERVDGVPQIIDKEEQAAIDAVAARHIAARKLHGMSAEEIAAQYEARHRAEEKTRRQYAGQMGESAGSAVGRLANSQQSLLPSIMDPKIFKLKCKPGNELVAVKAIFLKTIDIRNQGGLLKIKSVFCSDAKGFIYVEAISEAFAKEILTGLRTMYISSFEQIPVAEMTSVLSVVIQKKPLKKNQWVRIKRGPMKGDLARVVDLFEGGAKAFIQMVPRPDYTAVTVAPDGKKLPKVVSKVRPQQKLFDAEEARAHNGSVFRRHHPLSSSETFDVWNGEHYKDGFLFKEVNVANFLDENNVKPKLEELQMFRPRKAQRGDNHDDEDDENDSDEGGDASVAGGASNSSFIKELAEQIQHMGEEEEKDVGAVNPFIPGDLVQVTSGELRNLVARVTAVNDMTRIATIVPYNHELTASFDVEVDLLVKYIYAGAHVKVVGGRYMGQTGRVVSVNALDGDFIAAILTDGINTEIQCNVKHLQMSSEVTTGHGNLGGYELYDLVTLNENEAALVILVGAEKLRLINHMGNIKDVSPQEIQGKRNNQSAKSTGFDAQQNTITVGDTVNVTSGMHAKLTGTIKHMFKGTLWLHSNNYLKNSGIFVVKQRNCVVAGGKTVTPVLSASYRGVLLPTPNASPASSNATPMSAVSGRGAGVVGGMGGGGPGRGMSRDPSMDTTVRITKGAYKGLLAQVVDVTPTHFSVELLAKMKKIVIERSKTVQVGDKAGNFTKAKEVSYSSFMENPSTPFLTAATPHHFGTETPMHWGSETPSASRTPRGPEQEEAWTIRDSDKEAHSINNSTPKSYNSYANNSNPYSSSSAGGGQHSLHSAANSGITPTNSYMSSAQNSIYSAGTNTPLSSAGGAQRAPGSFRDWSEDLVVVIKSGQHAGKQAVIQHVADNNGMVDLSLRRNGFVDKATFRVHYDDVMLAEPPKKELAIVLSGKYKGKTGTVKAIQGKDVVMESNGVVELFKASNVGWLDSTRRYHE